MFIEELAGTKIFFIDDFEKDISPIMDKLTKMELSNRFIDASLESKKPDEPIKSVELIFLDLYFSMMQFDPELCADLIHKTVPEGKMYFLVIFSKDTDRANEVLHILEQIGLTPAQTVIKQKTEYDFREDSEIERLLNEINEEFESVQRVYESYGEIIEVEENEVVVDCLINEEEKIFQKRHFDIIPLSNLDLKLGKFILIKTIVKLGSVVFEFHNTTKDLSKQFNKDEFFGNIDENELLN